MQVRINRRRVFLSDLEPDFHLEMLPISGATTTAADPFDRLAALEDEGKVVLRISHIGELRDIVDPPCDWREWNFHRVQLEWDKLSGAG